MALPPPLDAGGEGKQRVRKTGVAVRRPLTLHSPPPPSGAQWPRPNPGAPVPPLVPPAKIFKWRLVFFSLFYIRKVKLF